MSMSNDAGMRVLVVDDDQVDREAVRRALLKLEPAPVIAEASCMREAQAQLSNAAFDCVVLDYRLPEGPCLEFLGLLRAQNPFAAFVVLTGQGDETVAVELMKAGAADYLSKDGLDPARLRHALKYAVALRQVQRQASEVEAQRRHYTDQLRRFVERAPMLVGARSLTDLTQATAALAVDVLDASEAFVLLQHSGVDYSSRRGGGTTQSSLATWAGAVLQEHGDDVVIDEGEQLAVRVRARDGTSRGMIALRLAGAPVYQARRHALGQLAVLVSVCSDNLVLYDTAARAVRARDDVMAVVSHDLRNPLNNVRLGVNLLRDAVPQKEQSVIERVERNVTHMARLVDDLVDMVRLEGGKLELNTRVERVADLLEQASQLIADSARDHGLRFTREACDAASRVWADRDRVLQVLSNLLGNALKFTPQGGQVTLAAIDEVDSVRFEVRDTGRGIPAEEGDKVFSRFWRSDPKKRQGLGLGLYIAKGLIQAQRGRLWFESEEGRGTSFFFTLPKPETVPDAQARSTPDASGVQQGRKAAVIEDDDDTRALIDNALSRVGFEVSSFGDAESFMAGTDVAGLSIVVSDIGLPGRDGIELCTALREQRRGIPMLLVTAFRDEATFHRARTVGCEILTKPLNFGQLAARAQQLAKAP
jgi:signal transduction histidine kinase